MCGYCRAGSGGTGGGGPGEAGGVDVVGQGCGIVGQEVVGLEGWTW